MSVRKKSPYWIRAIYLDIIKFNSIFRMFNGGLKVKHKDCRNWESVKTNCSCIAFVLKDRKIYDGRC